MIEWAKGKTIEWHKIPVNSQHYNGVAESMIRVTKRQLGILLGEQVLTKGELDTVMSDVMFIVNSRPLMLRDNSDPWNGGSVTPLHLLGGRSTQDIPTPRFDGKANLTKRLRFLEDLKLQFWKKWYEQVFPHLIPSYKWRNQSRNVKVGDVVLVKESNPVKARYLLGLVEKVMPGEDGLVRKVVVKYKNVTCDSDLKKLKFHETERSVQNIVVLVPVDWNPDEVEQAVVSGMKVVENFA